MNYATAPNKIGNYAVSGAAVNTPVKPDTLLSAMSSLADLNKRLHDLCGVVENLATAIGGPRPANADEEISAPEPQSAVGVLNQRVKQAHTLVGNAFESIEAMRRSLGN